MRALRMHRNRPGRPMAVATVLLALVGCGQSGEGRSRGTDAEGARWSPSIRMLDEALDQKNVSAAERAWHRSYSAALGSRTWEGMIAVGDAALRIGEAAGLRGPSQAKARGLYLSALFRARSQGSVEGVLRTAEAFDALGDREVVSQCLTVDEGLIAQRRGAESPERAAAMFQQFTVRLRGAPGGGDLF